MSYLTNTINSRLHVRRLRDVDGDFVLNRPYEPVSTFKYVLSMLTFNLI